MAIRFELYPSSCIVRAGDRIRLTLAGADADNLVVPTIGDMAMLRVTLDGDRASRLLLPIVNPHLPPTATARISVLQRTRRWNSSSLGGNGLCLLRTASGRWLPAGGAYWCLNLAWQSRRPGRS